MHWLDPGPWTLNRRLLQFFYMYSSIVVLHLSTALLLCEELVLEPSSLLCLLSLSLLFPFNFEPTYCFSAFFWLGLLQILLGDVDVVASIISNTPCPAPLVSYLRDSLLLDRSLLHPSILVIGFRHRHCLLRTITCSE